MKPGGKPEAGFYPDEAIIRSKDPNDLLEVYFMGGSKETVNITNKTFLKMQLSRARAKGDGPLWQGEHAKTKNTVKVAQRSDRTLLLSVYDQNRQVASVCTWDFGNLPYSENIKVVSNQDETVQKAFKFLKPFALRYAAGEFKDKSKLQAAIEEAIAKHRIRITPKGPVKLLKWIEEQKPWSSGWPEEQRPLRSNASEKKPGSDT